MKPTLIVACLTLPFSALNVSAATPPAATKWTYPATKTVDAADTHFGRTYKDPYRWLEGLKEKEVEDWFKAQAVYTDSILDRIPGRDALAKEWVELDKLKSALYSDIHARGGSVFYKKTLGEEKVGKLYCRQGWQGREYLLFDPGTYKPGVVTTLEQLLPSPDGTHVALGLSSGGAEVSEIRVLNVGVRTLLPERIYPSLGGPTGWTLDGRSFFYVSQRTDDIKSPEFDLNTQSKRHVLGSDPARDADFFSRASYPKLGITSDEHPIVSLDPAVPKYVLVSLSNVRAEARVFYAPSLSLEQKSVPWRVLVDPKDGLVSDPEIHGEYVYGVTYKGASRYRVVRTKVAKPDWDHAETIIPEAPDTIRYMSRSRDFLFIVYTNGVQGRIVKFSLKDGRKHDIQLPRTGTVGISCPDSASNRCLVFLSSWTLPTTTYDLDAETGTLTGSPFNTDVVYPGFEHLVAEEVEVKSHDGTLVPLSIIHAKGMPLDGNRSCILTGYGAYGSIDSPRFSLMRSVALKGVVMAVAHVRGGGEKGEAWYKAGYKTTKPNTWKDFNACAEYLIQQGYTRPGKLAGTGTSAGGILISRAITERPDLYAAAICNVGVANALRFEAMPTGAGNVPEFGTVKDRIECAALAEMDGVAHVQAGVNYPAVLGVAGWNDPRVVAWQPGKLVAALQNASVSGRPVLMKVNFDSGHFTEDKWVTYRNFADQFAFALWQTGHKDFQPVK